MYEWHETVQRMINWVDENLDRQEMLQKMSLAVGYSPTYCSMQFHRVLGMTVRAYAAGRRLARAVQLMQTTDARLLDIALDCGFSSQEALTRAFREAFGCTPTAYRRNPVPLPLPIRKVIYFPEHYRALHEGGSNMSELKNAAVRMEYIPPHRYLGVWDDEATDYCAFWQRHDCDEVSGVVDSMCASSDPIVTAHTAGWQLKDGKRRYFYGVGVPMDWTGPIPQGFELREVPGSYYLVFYHPAFDFMRDNGEVMRRVEDKAWNYDLQSERHGQYAWNEDACPCYQRHYPEELGYEVLRPVKRVK